MRGSGDGGWEQGIIRHTLEIAGGGWEQGTGHTVGCGSTRWRREGRIRGRGAGRMHGSARYHPVPEHKFRVAGIARLHRDATHSRRDLTAFGRRSRRAKCVAITPDIRNTRCSTFCVGHRKRHTRAILLLHAPRTNWRKVRAWERACCRRAATAARRRRGATGDSASR